MREYQRFQEEPFARESDEGIAEQTLVGQDDIAGYASLSLLTIPEGGNIQEGLLVHLQVIL